MSYYIRFVLTDDQSITLSQLEQALQATNPDYEIDGDIIVLDDEEFGQIEINERGDPLCDSDLELLREIAEQKQGKATLLAALNNAKSLIVVQPIWSREGEETLKVLSPLFHWLLENRKGLLASEGGSFSNSTGEIV